MTIIPEDIELHETLSNEKIPIEHVKFVSKHDFLIIYPQEFLQKSKKYILRIPFEGYLNDENQGYYKTFYYDDKRQESM